MRLTADFWPADPWLRKRAEDLVRETGINKLLTANGKYVDVGCGKGHIMETLERVNADKKIQVVGVDVYDYPSRKVQKEIGAMRQAHEVATEKRGLDFRIKDEDRAQTFAFARGEALPFRNGSMEGVSLFYVLHHLEAGQQVTALEEARRVIADRPDSYIFITEDIVANEDERQITAAVDQRLNWETEAEPHNYKSDAEWKKVFEDLGLEVAKAHYYSSGSGKKMVKHAYYALRKKKI